MSAAASNGNSRLMDMTIAEMRAALADADLRQPRGAGPLGRHAPARVLRRALPLLRDVPEPRLSQLPPAPRHPGRDRNSGCYLRRLLLMPLHRARPRAGDPADPAAAAFPIIWRCCSWNMTRASATTALSARMTEFLELVIAGLCRGRARAHHHLVFKAHPLEDGRVPLRAMIQRLARAMGVADRVHYVRGGKLARLLDHARTAVTVNSTAAQQVLWRGLPLKAFGRAVYAKPEFVSDPAAGRVLRPAPPAPTPRPIATYRRYLLETSRSPGGFYSARGRRSCCARWSIMMLTPDDPYDALRGRPAGNTRT